MAWRSQYRSRQHADAHAEGVAHAKPHDLDHPLVAQGDAEMVIDDGALAALVDHLRAAGSFAYDSEFIGELSYVPRLCLIQVATPQKVALIDPFADLDLKPFWELLADASVEKVVHAGEQDVEPVQRNLGRCAANFFDTQIAAGFVGLAYPVALAKLVQQLLGVKLGKGLTFTHWDQRPLSAMQLRYAADDVRFLPAIRAELARRLEKAGHAAKAKEESETLCDPERHAYDPATAYLKLRGAGSLSANQLLVLRELMNWRERCAERADVPPRAFLRDEILVDLARSPARNIEKLEKVRGLPKPVEIEYGQEIVETTLRALTMSVDQLVVPKSLEPTPAERFAADALFATVELICYGQSIDPALVASRQEVGEFYRALSAGESVDGVRLMRGWRGEVAGRRVARLYSDGGGFEVGWGEGLPRVSPA